MPRKQSGICPCGARLRGWYDAVICSECSVRVTGERVARLPKYTADSGRHFHARIMAHSAAHSVAKGAQLLLELHEASGKVARRRKDRDRSAVLAEIEKRGRVALEEERVEPKRGRSATLVYLSEGGEILEAMFSGLTQAEAGYIGAVSLRRRIPSRTVVWPSERRECPPVRIDHETVAPGDSAPECHDLASE